MKKQFESLKLGSKCILVHRKYAFQNTVGGRLIPARLKTWHNKTGVPEPIFTIIGHSKYELTLEHYIPFIDEQKAIKSIITKKKTNKLLLSE
jgi:hypothetical protein